MSELRAALEQISARYRRSSDAYRPNRPWPTEYAKHWHDGFHTALAECSIIADKALDPEGSAETDDLMDLGHWGTDREWFEATGNCGHCGQLGGDCVCTDDNPCGCGPHEPRTWPIPCHWCNGTGQQNPLARKATT